jgi:hypothetical protein
LCCFCFWLCVLSSVRCMYGQASARRVGLCSASCARHVGHMACWSSSSSYVVCARGVNKAVTR